MGRIVLLDELTSNKIAAGEVIENPASVVKELVENSLDAGAGAIQVEIKDGGKTFIKVMDNGSGIDEDDVEIAFERHATSKIRKPDDIENILTFGFRGEALASIAAVSNVEVITRTDKSEYGKSVRVRGNIVKDIISTGCKVGTTIVVRDLFYNTPARFKFLKKDTTEAGYVSDILSRIALGNPQVSFKLTIDGRTVFHTPGNNDLLSTVFSIYGKEISGNTINVLYESNLVKISGLIGNSNIARANRNQQSIFINRRYIRSRIITAAIDEACKTFLMKNKYAFLVLHLDLNPVLVDVNVHPAKMEVRFANENEIFKAVYGAIRNALYNENRMLDIKIEKEELPEPGPSLGQNVLKENAVDKTKLQKTPANHLAKTAGYGDAVKSDDVEKERRTTGFDKKKGSEYRFFQQKFDFDDKKIESTEKTNQAEINLYPPGRNLLSQSPNLPKETSAREEAPDGSTYIKHIGPKPAGEDNALENLTGIKHAEEKPAGRDDNSEASNEKANQAWMLKNSKILGQLFETYILLESDDSLLLIDQHAAHERIMYEQLREKYHKRESVSQMLLDSEVIELTHQEIKFLETEKKTFADIGFTYENFGNNSIILRSVPFIMGNGQIRKIFVEVLDYLINSKETGSNVISDSSLFAIACKLAVKANKKLEEPEIKSMLLELSTMDNPFNCPHGRPTVIKISRNEIEKMFKRKL